MAASMSTIAVDTAQKFVVAEIQGRGYILHSFADYSQFKRWRQANPIPVIVDRRNAHGRQWDYIDHTYDPDLTD